MRGRFVEGENFDLSIVLEPEDDNERLLLRAFDKQLSSKTQSTGARAAVEVTLGRGRMEPRAWLSSGNAFLASIRLDQVSSQPVAERPVARISPETEPARIRELEADLAAAAARIRELENDYLTAEEIEALPTAEPARGTETVPGGTETGGSK